MTVAGLLAATVSLIIVACWFVVPGLPWALLWRRRQRLDGLDTAALVIVLGVVVGVGVSGLLIAIGRLTGPGALILAALPTLAGFGILAAGQVQRALRESDETAPAPVDAGPAASPANPAWRPTLRDRVADPRLAAAALGLAFVALLGPQLVSGFPDGLPRSSTSWYYWNLSDVIAQTGSMPSSIVEWGEPRPFKADYLPFSAHLAGAQALDPTGLPTMEAYRLLVLALAAVLLVAFARRWSLAAGIFFSGLVVSSTLWSNKFIALKPETFAMLLLLGALWAIDRAWIGRHRSRWLAWSILAGILGGLTAGSHLEVFAVGGVLGLALGVVDPRGELRQRLTATAAALAVAAVVAGTLFLGTGVPGTRELAAIPTAAADPSWEIYTALVGGSLEGAPPPTSWMDFAVLADTARSPWVGLNVFSPTGLLVLAAILGLAVVAVLTTPAGRRPWRVLAFGAVVTVVLLVGSVVTFEAFETYVPRRIGPRRLLPYEMMGIAAMITAGGLAAREALILWRAERHRPDPGHPRRRRASPGIVLTVVAGGLCILAGLGIMGFGAYSRLRVRPDGPLSYAGRDAYLWLARNTEPDDRVLVNGYTDGVVTALSQRAGITDGRAPYGEDPAWQAQAVRDARLARAYFAAPTAESLAALAPDYVVVGPGGNLGTAVSYRAAQTLIDAQPELEPVAQFGPVTVYSVITP